MADAESPNNESPALAPERDPPQARNIVLVGFMATGKTTIGKIASRKSGYRFVDMDREIERQAGKPIPRIFSEDGESVFRDWETAVLRGLAGRDRCIIATGGGVVVRPENHPLLKDLGFVVWLHTKKRIIFDRVRRNPHRPLLKTEDPFATISAMVEERKPYYKAVADLKIKTTHLSPSEAAAGILETAGWFFRSHFPDDDASPGAGRAEDRPD